MDDRLSPIETLFGVPEVSGTIAGYYQR